MSDYASLARRLEAALGASEAVGVVIQASDRDAPPTGAVEASCVHWSKALATGSTRRTVAADHAGCSVGSYVHGFATREQAAQAEDTAMLVAAGWVEPEALAELPTLPAGTARLDYVPIAELEADPELVLLSLSPEQLMAVQAAIPALKLTGKPQCQIVPLAAAGVPCVSLGCAVSRARTGADPGRMTCALPTDTLLDAIDALEASARADRTASDAIRPLQ
jgi:uncharacterized protein (DUF169 family)